MRTNKVIKSHELLLLLANSFDMESHDTSHDIKSLKNSCRASGPILQDSGQDNEPFFKNSSF